MPPQSLTARELKRRVSAWRRAGRNTLAAALEMGIAGPTLRHSLMQAVSRGLLKRSEVDRAGRHQVDTKAPDFAGQRRGLERQVADLEAQVERLRSVKPVRYKQAPRLSRGPDDFVRIVEPDRHGMYADPKAFAAFLADVKSLDPHSFINTGDYSDCGGFLAQHHTLGYVAQSEYTYEQDMEACQTQIDSEQAAAPHAEFEYLEGNHEQRVERWCIDQAVGRGLDAEGLRRRNAPEYLLRFKERGIRYHRMADFHDGLPLRGVIRRGKCLFVHAPPKGCGTPGAIARRFGGCVVHGHTHHARAEVVSTVLSGTIAAFSPGCLCEIQPLYAHTNPTDWSHGYGLQLVARSGAFLHINVPIVNGVSLLRPLLSQHVKG